MVDQKILKGKSFVFKQGVSQCRCLYDPRPILVELTLLSILLLIVIVLLNTISASSSSAVTTSYVLLILYWRICIIASSYSIRTDFLSQLLAS